MQLRTPDRDRATSAAADPPADASSSRRLAKHLLTAAGLFGFTYAVLRVLGGRDDVPVQSVDEVQAGVEDAVPDEIQRRAADAVPGDRIETIRNRTAATVPDDITEISIDGPRSEESETDLDVDGSADASEGESEDADVTGLDESGDDEIGDSGADEASADVLEETETNADYTDERSDEEIAERAEPGVQDEPAEPGEMAVDEDVAADLVDTDLDAESDGESDESEE
ncbi:hypothetical protein [Natrinema versiforme]|uniref:Uncharacterized protein n=1 Tax=Natrinema versiforme TaxID=88724 RepID=A0A4V1FZ96_9EURY|nr:hypothetical protein [Natrinema versiforme]QCS41597.1 hypothetical protein FEJ81_04230 [Natrinema versiforme]